VVRVRLVVVIKSHSGGNLTAPEVKSAIADCILLEQVFTVHIRSVKHAAHRLHAALCKHARGPQKDTVIWDFFVKYGDFWK